MQGLNPRTGWCLACTNAYSRNSPTCVCGRLKEDLDASQCNYCRVEDYLREHADHIEHYMAQGKSFAEAITFLKHDNEIRCATCGTPITRTVKTAVFCHKNPKCRRAVRRYQYLKTKGMDNASALAQILEENGS